MTRPSARTASPLKGRYRTWIARYLPAEFGCTSAALLVAGTVGSAGGGAEAIALAGTVSEVGAFYAVMVARELRKRGGLATLPAAVRDLALEFGPAEALDSLLLRPVSCATGAGPAAARPRACSPST